jgi:lipoyl(octanoyl) transferase
MPGLIPYDEALELQRSTVANVIEGGEETLILLEHDPVYTMGRSPNRSSLLPGELPHPLHETNRGGQATWHGPGQLIGYPIIDLRKRGQDLHAYLRSLEDILIRLLESYGLAAGRRETLTGVWIDDRKIASIGVGVKKWVSMHGFALNVCNDLVAFSHIIPCGIQNVKMTSIALETGRSGISVRDVAQSIADTFEATLDELLPFASSSRES